MRWLEWLMGRNVAEQKDDIDVGAEVAAAKIKAAEVRKAQNHAVARMPEYQREISALEDAGITNHFGESITLGMRRRQHGN